MTNIKQWYEKTLGKEWFNKLTPFLRSSTMKNIRLTISDERSKFTLSPTLKSDMFKAFRLCPYSKVRVVIVGQDPYPNPKNANGLAFSYSGPYSVPHSLKNILREVESNIGVIDFDLRENADLIHWAEQGVLLLNTALTTRKGISGAHSNLWEPFTKEVFKVLQESTGIIYVLWGKNAKSFKKYINKKQNYILESSHPSPFSCNQGFIGCGHFKKINEIIVNNNGKEYEIQWLKN